MMLWVTCENTEGSITHLSAARTHAMVYRFHSHTRGRLPDFTSTEVNGKPFVDFHGPREGAVGIWIALVLQAVMMHSSSLAGLFSSPVLLSL